VLGIPDRSRACQFDLDGRPAGHLGWVVGVDRVGQADELRETGADVVVKDLAELLDEA
jgi:hypothetical protein